MDNLKAWHKETCQEEEDVEPNPQAVNLWMRVLEVVRLAFVDGMIPRAFTHGSMVLIPK